MDEINNIANREIEVDLEEEMRNNFMKYSMSVIVSRALPDVRDGLKPVHRRILYAMHEDNLTPDRPYRKSATTVGNVLGRYHPHGDSSIYGAMVRMAQDFSLRYPLVDGHGNFGSIDGHPPAAYRYTEARMSRMAIDVLTDIEKDTVNYHNNFDDTRKEPDVLPSRFPNLLVNGSSGIAVGMATNIPPHNLKEVIDAVNLLIDNPDTDTLELMEHIKGPDFPTGGIIMGYSGIRAAYKTGRGKIIVRARAEIEETENGRFQIIITEIPYMVNKLNLVKSIIDLSDSDRVEGITSVVDHSSREGMRVVIELRRDAHPEVVLNQLYRFSQMQTTFGTIMLALVDGVPKILNLKEMLEEYIKFQIEVITRRTQFDLNKAKDRAHILNALKVASDNIDEVISIIRASKDIPSARESLMERFEFDQVQANSIVRMRLGQLAGLEREKIEEELAGLLSLIAELETLVSNNFEIRGLVKEEALKMRDRYGDDRRTEISPVSGDVDIEDLITEEECVLTLTHFGYIKRQSVDVYKSQRRGGRGIMGMSTRDEDFPETMFTCSSHDYIMLFTTAGRVYRIKAYEVLEGSRTSKGINVINLLPLAQDEKVTAMIPVTDLEEELYLSMVTKQGIIKRNRLSDYANVRKSGIIAIDLRDGDELAWVRKTDGNQHLLVATKKGMAISFDENDARVMGRTAMGVRAIRLDEEDEIVGMAVLSEEETILTITETGYGRRSKIEDYRAQNRGGKGLINYHTDRFGDVAGVLSVQDLDDIILISSGGIIIRMHAKDINTFQRPAKGVRVMRLEDKDSSRIVAIARAEYEEDNGDGDEPETDVNEEGETAINEEGENLNDDSKNIESEELDEGIDTDEEEN